jgi:thiol-disulfide isomerase/thioredoxin
MILENTPKIITYIACFLSLFQVKSQQVSGTLSQLSNQSIKLEAFNGFKTYPIANTAIDEKGNFKLIYSKSDYGLGYLMSADNKAFFVILNGEDIVIEGESLINTTTLKTKKGKENISFACYASEHPRREQALSAWKYLEKIYQFDSLFSVQQSPKTAIEKEMNRIKKEDEDFLKGLESKSYVAWYLPVRRLVSDVSTIAQYRTEEIPATIAAFRNLDYTDERLYRSGLLRDAVESHFWLLENCGKSLDTVFIEMKLSIDAMMLKLIKDEKKLNEITDYLFDLLERHSLFQASEYLALKVLNEVSCTIDSDLAKQLETYRAMKIGNIASDILFEADLLNASIVNSQGLKKLSNIKSKYVLVVFGAGWCQKCTEELPKIAGLYEKWKKKELEVVYISLDEKKEDFNNFASKFPFLSYCDYKKWNSPVAKEYYVFGTPTMFLLDSKREIVLRPNSVQQMDAWVDWMLK